MPDDAARASVVATFLSYACAAEICSFVRSCWYNLHGRPKEPNEAHQVESESLNQKVVGLTLQLYSPA